MQDLNSLIQHNSGFNKQSLSSMILGLALTVNIASAEITGVEGLKDSHKPALNYPQSIEWSKKRVITDGYVMRASDVIGRSVYNGVGDELGEIDDVIIPDGESKENVSVVIEVGGFLGIGERLVTVPYSSLRIDAKQGDHVYFNVTEKQLGSLPEFKYPTGEASGKSIYSRQGSKR